MLERACAEEKATFKRNVRGVSCNPCDINTNIVSSHVSYEVGIYEGGALSLKARFIPNGNLDSIKYEL